MAFIIYIRLGSGYHVVPVGRPQELRDVVRVRVRGAGGGGGGGRRCLAWDLGTARHT